MRVMNVMVCGLIMEAPRPCTTRATISVLMSPESPHHSEESVKTTSPMR